MDVRVYVTPKHGILDPQGVAVERSLAGPRVRRRERACAWASSSSCRSLPRRGTTAEQAHARDRRDVPQAARQPHHRGLHVRDRCRRRHRSLRQPRSTPAGALRDRGLPRLQHRRRLPGTPSPLSPGAEPRLPLAQGHRPARRRRDRPARRILLRRLPALRRHRPLQPDHGRVRRLRRPAADWSRHLQRLPDPAEAASAARRPHPQHRPQVRLPLRRPARGERRHALHRRLPTRATCCASSSSTTRATTRLDPETLAAHAGQRPDRAALLRPAAPRPARRRPIGPTPTARSTTSPASATPTPTSSASCRTRRTRSRPAWPAAPTAASFFQSIIDSVR